ncbi:Flp pilus assembly protein CpaB [Brevundimonas goettingensis]|jgi:pilus assembly protein CpaB|uniref:Flp pilus assembly protein CpaB n=1 Tax=Brevundimonas goettingensis TaxID=2774190 RepID=A0A975C011_9CAUL|nr:Flp pilus assembly protein CpaB [Brevundimonas goettingensis]QTC91263.1 Flp pilus assembly protein CpaB [Brevundimonas goettingensis]
MKPARIAVICVAAAAAIGLAFVVRAMGSNGKPVAVATAAPMEAARPMAKVLVAARDLEPGKRLEDADLTWKDWPVDEVNPAFITDGTTPVPAPPTANEAKAAAGTLEGAPAAAAKSGNAIAEVARAANNVATGGAKADYYGSVVREPILAGEPIVARKIVRAGDSGYLAAYLEPGMRAMAIRVTVETAAGGFILPGDRVDVLLTRQTSLSNLDNAGQNSKFSSSTVMRNIKILAIDQTTRAGDDEQSVVGATATLEVGPADAEALALAKSEGELSLVLRSYADTAGPSGRVQVPRQAAAVRIFRGGAPEVVVVQ